MLPLWENSCSTDTDEARMQAFRLKQQNRQKELYGSIWIWFWLKKKLEYNFEKLNFFWTNSIHFELNHF